MTNAQTPEIHADSSVELTDEHFEEEYESMGDHHRMAARHFAAAAKHHLSAAAADDEGDNAATARHAYMAYRHQLNAVQYAEIATMDNDSLDDEHDGEADNS